MLQDFTKHSTSLGINCAFTLSAGSFPSGAYAGAGLVFNARKEPEGALQHMHKIALNLFGCKAYLSRRDGGIEKMSGECSVIG